jgi:hydroxypyruvate reductase
MKMVRSSDLVIFLISGGGSSCFELPLGRNTSIRDLVELYRLLISRDLDIVEINTIRKHLSRVKGGRLAEAAARGEQVTLYISDVPEDHESFIASGPSMPDESTVDEMYGVIRDHALGSLFPMPLRRLIEDRLVPETPKPDHPAFSRASWHKLLDNADALHAARKFAEEAGWRAVVVESTDDTPVWDAARMLIERAEGEVQRADGVPVAVITGGELISPVQGRGKGGRNQAFALECVERIAGKSIAVLSAGTDGIDGNSRAAGAIADGTSLERSRMVGSDVSKSREESDSNGFFSAIGDEVVTGPTGNNIRDIRIILAW